MLRHLTLAVSLATGIFGYGTAAHADCVLLDRLDRTVTIQTRLATNPDTALFASDIRQIRAMLTGISQTAALRAVNGNSFAGDGATVARFLTTSAELLQRASLDDPNSVRPHFTRRARQNLADMRTLLPAWRCSAEQIAIDAAAAETQRRTDGNSDEDEMENVRQTLNTLADEVLRLRTLVIMLIGAIIIAIATPIIQRHMILRRRRSKRHNCTYQTPYVWEEKNFDGMLVDINCYGTKLQHNLDTPPPQGSHLDLTICEEQIGGTVVWSNTHYVGVLFQKLIPLAHIDPIRAAKPPPQKQNGAPRDAALQNRT